MQSRRKWKCVQRVPNRFFGTRDLAYFMGLGILKERVTRFGIVTVTGTRDLAILTGGNRECRFKEIEIRQFQRLKYEKKIKSSCHLRSSY